MMIERHIERAILTSLRRFPVVGLVGSRQVGKTTLARAIARRAGGPAIHLDLERPSDLNRLTDAELYLEEHADRLVILDEIQRRPDLFPLLRALVDADRRPGRFLILGSASPDLVRQSNESLAGRIVYHELHPLMLDEVGPERWKSLWIRGGYPDGFRARSGEASLAWREAFIRTFLERDLPAFGVRLPSVQVRRLWEMLAHLQGQTWNASRVAGSLGLSGHTVRRYLDLMEDTFVLRQLRPMRAGLKKRLVKSPKIYLRDSGILHALLAIASLDALLAHPVAGPSWEGWILEQILALAPPRMRAGFYRTHAGAEIDLVLESPRGTRTAFEMKLSKSPRPSRGMREAMADLHCKCGYLIHPGTERYPLDRRIEAIPARRLHEIPLLKRSPDRATRDRATHTPPPP